MPAVITAITATVMAIREVDNPVKNARPGHTAPRSGSLALKQPTFDWKVAKIVKKCTTLKQR